jgi:hypothetical protein
MESLGTNTANVPRCGRMATRAQRNSLQVTQNTHTLTLTPQLWLIIIDIIITI